MPMVDLSIIIVSWNTADLLSACLESILADPQVGIENAPPAGIHVEIIVVDSASSDGTPALLAARFPQVILLPQTENVGFTRGNNIGLAQARGRHLLLLNPDTEVSPGALKMMLDYLDAHPDVGILGPHTLNSDGSPQSTRRRFPTLSVGLVESTWLQPLAPRGLLDAYYVNDVADDAIADVDWVQGSALMARRAVYEQIGGLDEGFIMYSEELDWCRRAKNSGWRIVYLGTARIVHHGGRSSQQVAARTHILFQQSKLRYFRKYHGALAAQTLRLVLLANYVVQLAIEFMKRMLGHKPDLRRERIQIYWQVLRSGLRVH